MNLYWQPLNLPLQEAREAHDYQVTALAAWSRLVDAGASSCRQEQAK
ncbi:MAG TPA: hypothetical protein VEL31_11595 [Ktedonobacteraceae bacterium]|nr:hypothetical protein [Ktedonobacteraceae bacterium]